MNAKEILLAIRMKHVKDIVLREVTVRDELEQARYRSWRDGIYAHGSSLKGERAEVPDGWNSRDAKFERRIDALVLARSKRIAVEIKVSRSDFLRETEEKRRAIRVITHQFVYCVPKGLVDKSEVPEYAGLWEVDPDRYDPQYIWHHGISVTKRAKVFDANPLPDYMVNALLHRESLKEYQAERLALLGDGK